MAFGHDPIPDGASYQLILEHVIKYPGSYELPLRKMYELNSTVRPQQLMVSLNPQTKSAFSENAGPSSTATHGNANVANVRDNAERLAANLMSMIAQRPSQPCSLPPSFIISFVQKAFPAELDCADFTQALTALDYLNDLEKTRRARYSAALEKINVPENGEEEQDDLSRRYPGVAEWVVDIKNKDRLAHAYYTQVYLRLRHWTLMHEMKSRPFNRVNCIAMLNTLFPPVTTKAPTPYLNDRTLRAHRGRFLELIRAFEGKGEMVLDKEVKRDMRPGEITGWPVTYEHIANYLQITNDIITASFDICHGFGLEEQIYGRMYNGRKIDSGVSFGSSDRPLTSDSNGSSGSFGSGSYSGSYTSGKSKQLPPIPPEKKPRGAYSTLERIAKEIKRMKSRPNIDEIVKEPAPARPSVIKRVKSAGLLRRGREKKSDEGDNDDSAFDVEHFRQKRLEWEAQQAKRTSG